ncbi:MAG: DUF1549 domain-containing protein, partial [Opitutaceae bacterium]
MSLNIRIALLLGLSAATCGRSAPVDYGREVRPILSDKCYHCHGPDEKGRKAKLRFDTKEGAFRVKDDIAAIVPGKSAESELIFRVTSTDTEEVMPPPEAKLGRLSPAEIDTLKRWIDEGAPYQSHWSFEPLAPVAVGRGREGETERRRDETVSPSLPPSVSPSLPLPLNPIDAFVRAKLTARKLAPQPEADRATLIRRVAFDLTGLPPSPEEVDAFGRDAHPQAYERLVDRLLQSPRYG